MYYSYLQAYSQALEDERFIFSFLWFTVSEAHGRLSVARHYITGVAFSKSTVCSEVLNFSAACYEEQ